MKYINLDNCEGLKMLLTVEKSPQVFILFIASKDSNGVSWCPDCVSADPVIQKAVSDCDPKMDQETLFITAQVGARDEWKNPNNSFRLDETFKVDCVPTLLNIQKNQRLRETECADREKVEKFLLS
ncbi:thioredoxin domain-containing protein 17-like [Brevipalpus obovatus]|uniref:thioredoxin domain-containing protein 17-like n=1 Tax=Brevipalpus obovatus TaxID=246614 RepID=UPI003D9EE49F